MTACISHITSILQVIVELLDLVRNIMFLECVGIGGVENAWRVHCGGAKVAVAMNITHRF